MNTIKIARCDLDASEIALGCMRIASLSNQDIATLVHTALDAGITFFDHADVYGGGKSEEKFAEALDMTPRLRNTMILQTKVGIRIGRGSLLRWPEHDLSCNGEGLHTVERDFDA